MCVLFAFDYHHHKRIPCSCHVVSKILYSRGLL